VEAEAEVVLPVLEDAFPVLGLLYFQKSSSELFLDCESSALYRYPSHTK
jgi:hypothetical protein